MKKRKKILFLTVSNWHEPKRIRQQLAQSMRKDHDIIYITLPSKRSQPNRTFIHEEEGFSIYQIKAFPMPITIIFLVPFISMIYQNILYLKIKKHIIKNTNIDNIICFTPSYPYLLRCFSPIPISYLMNDDYVELTKSFFLKKMLKINQLKTIDKCANIISTSEITLSKLKFLDKPKYVFYPGHDSTILDPYKIVNSNIIEDKTACFFGYIDWRIDFDLIEKLLKTMWSVTLIGPISDQLNKIKYLQVNYPDKFKMQEPIDPKNAPQTLSRFSVLLIPYKYKTAQQARDLEMPNKLFVYFSALRPVVTTFLPNLKKFEDGLVFNSKNHDDFLLNCFLANETNKNQSIIEKRYNLALSNTWDNKLDEIYKILFCKEKNVS